MLCCGSVDVTGRNQAVLVLALVQTTKKQTFMCFISPTDKLSENDWNTAVLTQPTHILAIDSVVALVTFAKHLCIIHGLSTKVASDKSYHACPVSSSLRLTTFYITKGILNIVCWGRQTGPYRTEINRVVNRPNNQSSAKKQANRVRENVCGKQLQDASKMLSKNANQSVRPFFSLLLTYKVVFCFSLLLHQDPLIMLVNISGT